MRESLLVEDGITLLSERSTLRKNRKTHQLSSILSTESPAVAMRVHPIPSQKALKVLGDSSCLSPGGSVLLTEVRAGFLGCWRDTEELGC